MAAEKIISLDFYKKERAIGAYLLERNQQMQPTHSSVDLDTEEHNVSFKIELEDLQIWVQICELLIERYAYLLDVQQKSCQSLNIKDDLSDEEALPDYYLQKLELDLHLSRYGPDRKEDQESIFLYEIHYWRYWWLQLTGAFDMLGISESQDGEQFGVVSDCVMYYITHLHLSSLIKGLRTCIDWMNGVDGNIQVTTLCNKYIAQFRGLLEELNISEASLLDKLHIQLSNVTRYEELYSTLTGPLNE